MGERATSSYDSKASQSKFVTENDTATYRAYSFKQGLLLHYF